jgi:hypothetical protein
VGGRLQEPQEGSRNSRPELTVARPEASLWDYLRGLLPTGIHYSRIESETCPGFPDVHFTLEGVTGSIELKSTRKPGKFPFSGDKGLRKSQIDWIKEEVEAGGWVLLCLEAGSKIYLLQAELYYDVLHDMDLDDIAKVATLSWVRGADFRDQLAVALVNKP